MMSYVASTNAWRWSRVDGRYGSGRMSRGILQSTLSRFVWTDRRKPRKTLATVVENPTETRIVFLHNESKSVASPPSTAVCECNESRGVIKWPSSVCRYHPNIHLGETEKNYVEPQSGWAVLQPRIEYGTYWMQIRCVTSSGHLLGTLTCYINCCGYVASMGNEQGEGNGTVVTGSGRSQFKVVGEGGRILCR